MPIEPPAASAEQAPTDRLPRGYWFDSDATPPPLGFVPTQHISELTTENPSDEPCVFCDPPLNKHEVMPFDFAVPVASGHIAVKVALGMMRPAYLLGVTREHLTSFAQLDPTVLTEVDETFTTIEERTIARLSLIERTSQRYESYIRLEHGSDNSDSCGLGAGACVTHAHQHLIPATPYTADRMLGHSAIQWQSLESYDALAKLRGEPYLYIGCQGAHYAAVNPGVVSQWGRRIIAEEDGHDNWDWAVGHGVINLVQSLLVLGLALPPGKTHVTLGSDTAVTFPEYGRGRFAYED